MGSGKDRDKVLEMVDEIVRKDDRYKVEAYLFIRDAFMHTMVRLGKGRHLTGRDLLEGIRKLGLERFGPTARMVFEHWGVKSTEDFGQVVMNLVAAGLMHKADEDTLREFRDVFDFREEFEEKYKFRIDRDLLSGESKGEQGPQPR